MCIYVCICLYYVLTVCLSVCNMCIHSIQVCLGVCDCVRTRAVQLTQIMRLIDCSANRDTKQLQNLKIID